MPRESNGFSCSLDAVAIQAGDIAAVPRLVAELFSYLNYPINEHQRLQLVRIARLLVQALETPRETVLRLCWAEPTLYGAIIVAIDCGIFSYMSQTSSDPVLVDHLARMTEMDPILTGRLMKHLSAMGVFRESGQDTYVATKLSQTLSLAKYAGGFPCMADGAMQAIYRLPEYFRSVRYCNPDDAAAGPFQFAYKTSQHWFQWLSDHPALHQQFSHHMSAYHQGRPSWMDHDFYPVKDSLLGLMKAGPNAVLLVDIGGGLGHDLQEFHRKHPTAPGRLIVQEKADVIQQIPDKMGRIEYMTHDFFYRATYQRAYFLHSVLHDWPDAECKRILRHISAAMIPGYSKLLINENVVPDQGADWQITGLDLMLMTLVSARERRESEWRQLLSEAGFKILHIWNHVNGGESLIECQLA